MLVDDLLIYNGILDKFCNKKGVINYRDVIFGGEESSKYQERGGFVKYGKLAFGIKVWI